MRKQVLLYPEIKDLYYLIVFPLLKDKPNRSSADAWLEQMWAVDKYPIKKFRAINNIHLPGAIWVYNKGYLTRHKGYGPRHVINGQELLCRFDLPHLTVDIEVLIKSENKHCVFTLSVAEWDQIVKRLKEIPNE